MKWIKYQILSDPDDYYSSRITKKIEYNEANLALATKEAYAGAYKIEEDEEELPKKPLTMEYGGTNAITRANASQNVNFIGAEPIKSSDEDTVQKWAELGTGFAFYGNESLIGLPTKGFIESKCYTNPETGEIFISQVLRSAISGASYHRAGSSNHEDSWFSGWTEILDENTNKMPVIQYGYINDIKIAGGTIEEKSVIFPNKFLKTPRVLLQLYSNSVSTDIGKITVALSSAPSKTRFKIKLFNAASYQRAPSIYWVAISI